MKGQLVCILARPLPGYQPRPDLAQALKRLLRDYRLRCVSVGECGEQSTVPVTVPDEEEIEVF